VKIASGEPDMDKPTLYIETTIPSFLLAEPSRDLVASARQEITRAWWRRDHARFEVFVSQTVLDKAQKGSRSLPRQKPRSRHPQSSTRMKKLLAENPDLIVGFTELRAANAGISSFTSSMTKRPNFIGSRRTSPSTR